MSAPRLPCGCERRWLTEISEPAPIGKALALPCPCCGAGRGKRCVGGAAGFIGGVPRGFSGAFGADRMGYADVCPARLEQQLRLA